MDEHIDKETFDEMKKLVLARMRAASDELIINLGSNEYTKEQILESVEKGDELGKQIIEIQMEYLRDMARGNFYNQNE